MEFTDPLKPGEAPPKGPPKMKWMVLESDAVKSIRAQQRKRAGKSEKEQHVEPGNEDMAEEQRKRWMSHVLPDLVCELVFGTGFDATCWRICGDISCRFVNSVVS